jgi:hypothetical protein
MLEFGIAIPNQRAYTPNPSEDDKPGRHGALVEASLGDWSWKPDRYVPIKNEDGTIDYSYRFFVTGPRCTCTRSLPIGTGCARHS